MGSSTPESVQTSRSFIRERTTIPVPEILGCNCTFDNELGCPYMLMNRIRGWPIPDVVALAGGMTEAQILKIHAQMAAVTWQLAMNCTFPVIGQLQAQRNGETSYPLGQIIDRHARQLGPFQSSNDYYIARSVMIFDPTVDKGPFPLQHPDLHRQNVLIDKDWNVVAIIDWSWCSTVPWQSFQPFPFNLAAYITPPDQKLCEIHEELFWKIFKSFDSETEIKGRDGLDVNNVGLLFRLSRSKVGRIAKLMNQYAYPIPRGQDAKILKQVLDISQ